jgi:hypothetical protein
VPLTVADAQALAAIDHNGRKIAISPLIYTK